MQSPWTPAAGCPRPAAPEPPRGFRGPPGSGSGRRNGRARRGVCRDMSHTDTGRDNTDSISFPLQRGAPKSLQGGRVYLLIQTASEKKNRHFFFLLNF